MSKVLTQPAAAAPRAGGLAWHRINRVQERVLGYALISPVALLILLLIAYPFVNAVWLSLTEKMVGYPAHFVGLKNYTTLWESARFRIVAWNSVVYTVGSICTKLAWLVAYYPDDGGVRITGQLTVRGTTRPAAFDATVSATGDEVRLDGKLPVNRADFGLTWNRIGIAPMDNTIVIHAVFTRA